MIFTKTRDTLQLSIIPIFSITVKVRYVFNRARQTLMERKSICQKSYF